MNCPNCHKPIAGAAITKYFASKGGKASKRTITPEQQAMMQKARKSRLTPAPIKGK